MRKEYLFVYGTLRRDYGLALLKTIAGKMMFAGEGTVVGMMYDLGKYPAGVKTNRQNEIKGDVYELKEPEEVLAILDQYEGEEYQREKTRVQAVNGNVMEAFIYWFTGEIKSAHLIEENDYLNYLKNKKERFV